MLKLQQESPSQPFLIKREPLVLQEDHNPILIYPTVGLREKRHSFNCSLWTANENHAYMRFLELNQQLFYRSKTDRRLFKINVLMSIAVGSRSPDQCRSHHQKMMKYHGDIPSIIDHIRKNVWEKKTKAAEVNSDKERVKQQESYPIKIQAKVEQE